MIGIMIMVKSFDYFIPDFNRGFLIGKEAIFPYYKIFLYSHIIGSPIALFAGITQFTLTKTKFHQFIGKIYVSSIIFLAAPGALIMSFFSIGGTPSVLNFLLMSILWILFTSMAYKYALLGEIEKHKSMMIRSLILTNSAIFIRLLSYINHHFLLVELELGYIMISWLSWLPVLTAYELKLIKNRTKQLESTKYPTCEQPITKQ